MKFNGFSNPMLNFPYDFVTCWELAFSFSPAYVKDNKKWQCGGSESYISFLPLTKTHFLQGYAIVSGSFVKIFEHLLHAGHFHFCGCVKISQPGLKTDTAST